MVRVMREPVNVQLKWSKARWWPHRGDTWENVLSQLKADGLDAKRLAKAVYVIRLAGYFTIDYGQKDSPVVYIGEGRVKTRVQSHSRWASQLEDLVSDLPMEICVATPCKQGQGKVHRDCEAALLARFASRFGCIPLRNRQRERRIYPHNVYTKKQVEYALGKRQGAKYEWALRPLPASPFYKDYHRGR